MNKSDAVKVNNKRPAKISGKINMANERTENVLCEEIALKNSGTLWTLKLGQKSIVLDAFDKPMKHEHCLFKLVNRFTFLLQFTCPRDIDFVYRFTRPLTRQIQPKVLTKFGSVSSSLSTLFYLQVVFRRGEALDLHSQGHWTGTGFCKREVVEWKSLSLFNPFVSTLFWRKSGTF